LRSGNNCARRKWKLNILKSIQCQIRFKNIHTEDDALKAASLFEKGKVFDIALTDMTLPGMNGIELLEGIKTMSPRTECIMLTAVNDARNAVECLKNGADDYLLKPIKVNYCGFYRMENFSRWGPAAAGTPRGAKRAIYGWTIQV